MAAEAKRVILASAMRRLVNVAVDVHPSNSGSKAAPKKTTSHVLWNRSE